MHCIETLEAGKLRRDAASEHKKIDAIQTTTGAKPRAGGRRRRDKCCTKAGYKTRPQTQRD